MTAPAPAPEVLLPRPGGGARRLVLGTATGAVWAAAAFLVGTGALPELDGVPTPAATRLALVVLGLALAAAPVLVVHRPERRRVRAAVAAVLAARQGVPALPPFADWAGPERAFRRMQWSAYSYLAVPLLLLVGSAVAFGLLLQAPVAGAVAAVLALVPGAFLVVTARLPQRLRAGVAAGLAAGQVVGVAVDHRVDQRMAFNDAFLSWFDARLPDGRRVVLRTPLRFTWAADAPGVLSEPDLQLVVGAGGRQGVLVAPDRPQDAVWLLGPVPQVRVPRSVLRALRGAPEPGPVPR